MKRAIAVLAAAIFLAGCGEGPTSTKPSLPNPLKPSYKILTKKQLQAAVVPLNDLPTGFAADPPDKDASTTKYFCDYKPPYKERIIVRQSFTKGGGFGSEFILVGLRQYDSVEHAKKSFAALVKTMKTCRKDMLEGSPITYSLLSMPEMEDGSIGISTDAEGLTLPNFFVLVGPTMISTGGGGMMNANTDAYVDVLRKQIARYKAVAER
jgi:hypothetical protein